MINWIKSLINRPSRREVATLRLYLEELEGANAELRETVSYLSKTANHRPTQTDIEIARHRGKLGPEEREEWDGLCRADQIMRINQQV